VALEWFPWLVGIRVQGVGGPWVAERDSVLFASQNAIEEGKSGREDFVVKSLAHLFYLAIVLLVDSHSASRNHSASLCLLACGMSKIWSFVVISLRTLPCSSMLLVSLSASSSVYPSTVFTTTEKRRGLFFSDCFMVRGSV
jgi:hypothetical protein